MKRICEVTDEVLKDLVATAEQAGPNTGVCPVEAAYEIAKKAALASCGKGVFCREGILQMYIMLGEIRDGKGSEEELENIESTLKTIVKVADCDLSFTAASEMLKLITNFRGEFEDHVKRKSCSNLICPGCHTVHINAAKCTGSGECIKVCEAGAIKGGAGLFSVIDQAKCTSCNKCIAVCAAGAIAGAGFIKPQGPTEPAAVGSWGAAAGGRRRRG